MGITNLYTAWIKAETAAQLGAGKLAEAKAAKSAFADAAKALVKRLPFRTGVAVRSMAEGRYDVAEHAVARELVEVNLRFKPFRRQEGEALCQRTLRLEYELTEVKRRAPSCARCLAVVEALVAEPEA